MGQHHYLWMMNYKSSSTSIFMKYICSFHCQEAQPFFCATMELPSNTAASQNVFPNIRKWIVTACYEKKRDSLNIDEEVLRRAMCHSDRVAKKCYLREDMTTTAASAMDIISMCTLSKKKTTTLTQTS